VKEHIVRNETFKHFPNNDARISRKVIILARLAVRILFAIKKTVQSAKSSLLISNIDRLSDLSYSVASGLTRSTQV